MMELRGDEGRGRDGIVVRLLTWWTNCLESTGCAAPAERGGATDMSETSLMMRAFADEFWV